MKLHSPRFEKALRRGVKQLVKASPGLKKEFRQANRYRRQVGNMWVRPLFTFMLAAGVMGGVTASRHVATGLAIINIWLVGALCYQTMAIKNRIYRSNDLGALHLLPVETALIFRWELQKYGRYTLFLLLDLVVAFGMLAYSQGWGWGQLTVALLLAVFSWGGLLAMIGFCATRLPPKPFALTYTGMLFAGMAFIFGHKYVGQFAFEALDHWAPVLNVVLPTGWLVLPLQLLMPESPWWPAMVFGLVLAVPWIVRDSLKRLSAPLEPREMVMPQVADVIPEQAEGDADESRPATGSASEKPRQLGPTAIEEMILSRLFFSPPTWPQRGWLEQQFWNWLNQRERTLSEFVFPNGLALTVSWRNIFRNLAIAMAVAGLVGFYSLTAKICILAVGLVVTILAVLAVGGSRGRTFLAVRCSGVNIPMYAAYGIGFKELSRFLFKYAFIQLPFLLVLCLAAGMASAVMCDFPFVMGMIFGIKCGCMLFFGRYIAMTMGFSFGTNDTAGFKLRAWALLFFAMVLAIGFLILGGMSLFDLTLTGWGLCAGAALDAYAFFWIYRWFYFSGRFDLMSFPRQ